MSLLNCDISNLLTLPFLETEEKKSWYAFSQISKENMYFIVFVCYIKDSAGGPYS